jgi:hypothetical protein
VGDNVALALFDYAAEKLQIPTALDDNRKLGCTSVAIDKVAAADKSLRVF